MSCAVLDNENRGGGLGKSRIAQRLAGQLSACRGVLSGCLCIASIDFFLSGVCTLGWNHHMFLEVESWSLSKSLDFVGGKPCGLISYSNDIQVLSFFFFFS